jgi:hypothetical protein
MTHNVMSGSKNARNPDHTKLGVPILRSSQIVNQDPTHVERRLTNEIGSHCTEQKQTQVDKKTEID